MASSVPIPVRDALLTGFRQMLCEKLNITPFTHQAEWWAASDGNMLLDVEVGEEEEGMWVLLPDKTRVKKALMPRQDGRARVIADLGAFKVGKSFGSALWVAAFACIPGARVQLVGVEYDICVPEFEYLLEFLLSDRGLGIKAEAVQNRPKDGRLWLELPNGARFEARSWERKDSMKGKEIDCYLYCEAYMLPGLECYTSFSQNLRVRDGYAVFATTPDRPWVKDIHDAAHSGLPEFAKWHCTCSVSSEANPYSFDQGAKDRDRNLMTREKFAIHYEGKLGDFVGRVFQYQRGEKTFSSDQFGPREHLKIPAGWEIVGACDTGTFASALLVALSPEGDAYVLEEFPNYRYVASVPERDETLTIPSWAKGLLTRSRQVGGKDWFYADQNSQFKVELRNYGVHLEGNKTPLETRTEIAREYFQLNKIFLAPWLSVLPFELENAQWPEETSAAGKFARIKNRDHTLDCLEHILSRRPVGKWNNPAKSKRTWLESYFGTPRRQGKDRHLGVS
jgi:hypothetical protein